MVPIFFGFVESTRFYKIGTARLVDSSISPRIIEFRCSFWFSSYSSKFIWYISSKSKETSSFKSLLCVYSRSRAHEELYKVGQGTLAGGLRFLLATDTDDTTRKALVIRTLNQPPTLILTAYVELLPVNRLGDKKTAVNPTFSVIPRNAVLGDAFMLVIRKSGNSNVYDKLYKSRNRKHGL